MIESCGTAIVAHSEEENQRINNEREKQRTISRKLSLNIVFGVLFAAYIEV